MAKNTSISGKKQVKKRGNPNIREVSKNTQFKPNNPVTGEKDPRINRSGTPRKFDALRERVLDLLAEEMELKRKDPAGAETITKLSQVDRLLRKWILSGDFQQEREAIQIGFGKVPDELRHRFDEDAFIQKHLDKFTDGELTRIQAGENGMDILLDKLESQVTRNKK